MIRLLAWLWVAALWLPGVAGYAQSQAPRNAAPPSMDRHLPPDEFPTNVVKILRTTNKAQTNSYVPVVYTFKNVNPFDVIRFLHRPVQTEEGLLFTFQNEEGTGGKVLFCVPQYTVPHLMRLCAQLDRPALTSSDGTLRIYYHLHHRRADPSDPDFIETAASLLTGNESDVIVDPETNSLFFEDAPSGSKDLIEALDTYLDQPTAMVQLVVKIYELDAMNDTEIGLDYLAWKNGPGANLFAVGAFAEHGSLHQDQNVVFDPLGTGASGLPRENFSASGYNYAYRVDVPSAFFDYLTVRNKARVLNQMKLAALNTYPATVSAGQQVLYYAVQTSDPSGIRDTHQPFQANTGRVVVGTVNERQNNRLVPVETGVELNIIPIIAEQTVKLDLNIDWSEVTGFEDTGFPLINERTLETRVDVPVGEEMLIGGIKRQARVNGTNKVPVLGSIPILGYLFGGETTANRQTELVVVIQPITVTQFDVTTDYVIADEDQEVMEMVASEAAPLPKTTVGFDQAILDPEYGMQEPIVDETPHPAGPVAEQPASLPMQTK